MLAAVGITLLLNMTPVKVAVPGATVVGMDPAVADAFTEHFVTVLGRAGTIKLITQRDIGQTLGLERQKELLGCPPAQSSCLAELAGALGVDAILSIGLARTGTSYTATLRMLNALSGSEIASATERLRSEDALQDWLDAQAPQLISKVLRAFNRGEQSVRAKPVLPFVAAATSLAIAATGGVLFGLSRANGEQLRSGVVDSRVTAHRLASTGQTFEQLGLGLMIVGGVALTASTVWIVVAPLQEVQVVLLPTPVGGAMMVRGRF